MAGEQVGQPYGSKLPLFDFICRSVGERVAVDGAMFGAVPLDLGHKVGIAMIGPDGRRHAFRFDACEYVRNSERVLDEIAAQFTKWWDDTSDGLEKAA